MKNFNHVVQDAETGILIHFLDTQKHRADGYAICYPDGSGQYWLFGERFPTLAEFQHRLRKEQRREERAEQQRRNRHQAATRLM